jgi:hypothetical protein
MWFPSPKWRLVFDFAGHVTNGFTNWWVASSPTIPHNISTRPVSSLPCSPFIPVPKSMIAESFPFFPSPPSKAVQLFFRSVLLPRRSRIMMGAAFRWVLRLATKLPSSGLPERTETQEGLQPTPCCDLYRLSCDGLGLTLSVSTRHRILFLYDFQNVRQHRTYHSVPSASDVIHSEMLPPLYRMFQEE